MRLSFYRDTMLFRQIQGDLVDPGSACRGGRDAVLSYACDFGGWKNVTWDGAMPPGKASDAPTAGSQPLRRSAASPIGTTSKEPSTRASSPYWKNCTSVPWTQ